MAEHDDLDGQNLVVTLTEAEHLEGLGRGKETINDKAIGQFRRHGAVS